MEQFARIRTLIAWTFGVREEQISEATSQGDIAPWDSLGQIKLMLALEQAFGVQLEVDDLEVLNSVPALVAYLSRADVG
jgi:acyl carrier protein